MMEITNTVPHPPSVKKHNFNCPHCGAHADQTWFKMAAELIGKGDVPHIPDIDFIASIESDKKIDDELRNKLIDWAEKVQEKLVFFEKNKGGHYLYHTVYNLHLSKCFSCKKIAVWVFDELLFPQKEYSVPPNEDLPQEILNDYEEASSIIGKSPRGAAALLRLAIQKLCIHLGQPGNNINKDIASLVKQGLDTRVQKALDIVRVVGNNAVHPGQIDLRDNKDTAESLFGLVNIIAEKMISEPKHVESMFEGLPDGAKEQIEKRDND
jgi:hypothetical protein